MLSYLSVDNAAALLHTADMHNARGLRERCLRYVLRHFDEVSKTSAFAEVGRTNFDLIEEVLQLR